MARDTRVDEKDHYSLTCFVNDLHGRKWEKLPSHERRAAALKQLTKGFKNHPDVFKQIEYLDQIWQHEEFSRGALASIHALGHLTKYASVYDSLLAIYISLEPSIARNGKDTWRGHFALENMEQSKSREFYRIRLRKSKHEELQVRRRCLGGHCWLVALINSWVIS